MEPSHLSRIPAGFSRLATHRLHPFAKEILGGYADSQLVDSHPFVPVRGEPSGSSHDSNQALGAGTLGWQRGYGVVSFGKRNLPWVLEYIAHQKEHHARSNVVDRLERADVDD